MRELINLFAIAVKQANLNKHNTIGSKISLS